MDVRVRCVTLYQDKIIMIHRVRPTGEEYFYFPGGGVDEGELPETACTREMLEETTLTTKPLKLLGIQLHTDQNGDHCQMYYLVEVVSGTLQPGTGVESTIFYRQLHGLHTPIALSFSEFSNHDDIRPGNIKPLLTPYLSSLIDTPFFIIDERTTI